MVGREKCDDWISWRTNFYVHEGKRPKLAAIMESHFCAKCAQKWGTPCVTGAHKVAGQSPATTRAATCLAYAREATIPAGCGSLRSLVHVDLLVWRPVP